MCGGYELLIDMVDMVACLILMAPWCAKPLRDELLTCSSGPWEGEQGHLNDSQSYSKLLWEVTLLLHVDGVSR